ncbi:hypothetical protein MUY35_04025 [Aliiroseovarius sp. S1339]|uniref:hypothetical protein n=1 Tax=Aliiroseovarius sp. S1339 TaxID=2936990 RepID=UPI0020C0D551|nr:hypothetical protein [Aliiroseovarius sp. S1339]MCK8463014.1 hypothetical protein [Aliiroseovarius sp. S1339]
MRNFEICAKFELFPSGHKLPPAFNFSSMNFVHNSGSKPLVLTEANENGLRFEDQGIKVTLPTDADAISIRCGSWADHVLIECYDRSGTLVASQNVVPSGYLDFELVGNQIRTVAFLGGSNEALIASICASLDCD